VGTPLYLAITTFGFFTWLDKRSSEQANRTISQWLKKESYKNIDLASAIINAFDIVYTTPLLSKRAFIRSAVISLISFAVWRIIRESYYPSIYGYISFPFFDIPEIVIPILSNFIILIIADYICLYIVRGCLKLAMVTPIEAAALSILLGITVLVLSGIFAILITTISFREIIDSRIRLATPITVESVILWMIPAVLSQFWLICFVISYLGIRAFYPLFDRLRKRNGFCGREVDIHFKQLV
jgi:hypothetical protein